MEGADSDGESEQLPAPGVHESKICCDPSRICVCEGHIQGLQPGWEVGEERGIEIPAADAEIEEVGEVSENCFQTLCHGGLVKSLAFDVGEGCGGVLGIFVENRSAGEAIAVIREKCGREVGDSHVHCFASVGERKGVCFS